MEYISLKLCPICGEVPERITQDLGRPGGHGYPGCTQYRYECECCKLLKGAPKDDISCTKEEAIRLAKESWNIEAERVLALLMHRWVDKELARSVVKSAVKFIQ